MFVTIENKTKEKKMYCNTVLRCDIYSTGFMARWMFCDIPKLNAEPLETDVQ